MSLTVRQMHPDEASLVVDYFHQSSAEHLEMLGVDPTRLPERDRWLARFAAEHDKPLQQRSILLIVWEQEGRAVGFSTADKIVFGEQANMHLHVTDAARRQSGIGTECVRATAAMYFRLLELKRLFCEPNAFNVAPNRTLQAAGFKYLKTHLTVPGPLNYHQAVTRWVLELPASR